MNILVAADSFKDALTALEVCQCLESGILTAHPGINVRLCPLADGGEGTFEALVAPLGLHRIEMAACDPLFIPIKAIYGRSTDGKTAFIELAKTAGLQLLLPEDRNPLSTSTFGVGQQIADAVHRGAEHIILAIGGSATLDVGIGMAAALGWQFLDKKGKDLPPIGQSLAHITTIVPPEKQFTTSVEVICDVNNPLFGPRGAAMVYARQKGANDAAILQLEDGLKHFAGVAAQRQLAPEPDTPGSGAAGGLGFGAKFFLNAKLRPGVEVVLDLLDIEEKIDWADLVVTGEGSIDHQTTYGKLIQGLCRCAAQKGKPVIGFCGQLTANEQEIKQIGLSAAYCINAHCKESGLSEMLKNTGENLEKTAQRVFKSMTAKAFKGTRLAEVL